MNSQEVAVGFDFGTTRIGAAVGNTVTRTVRPLSVLAARTNEEKWSGVGSVLDDWMPGIVIVGVPRFTDGTPGDMTRRASRFARQIGARWRLPVYVVDERYSSVEAGDDSSGPVDDMAAAVILQQWFDEGCPQRRPL